MSPLCNWSMERSEVTARVRTVFQSARKVRRAVNPYLPVIVRVLLVSTFLEDGLRVMQELDHQISFLSNQYYFPPALAGLMLFGNIAVSLVGVVLVLAQKRIARGAYETLAAYLLIGCVLYQQALYGRHSPIGSGNVGFLVRNLCLSGSLLLISCQARMAEGRSALPLGILDSGTDKKTTVAYMQLASRILLVLLAIEFVSTLGVVGTILTVPVICAVLAGYRLEISGTVLLGLYFVHNILNSAFWTASSSSYVSQIMQYEFFQTLSIMGGLLLLIITGPGSLSVDEMRSRKAF